MPKEPLKRGRVDPPDPIEVAVTAKHLQRFYLEDVTRLLDLVFAGQRLMDNRLRRDRQVGESGHVWTEDAEAWSFEVHRLGVGTAGYMLSEHWRKLEEAADRKAGR